MPPDTWNTVIAQGPLVVMLALALWLGSKENPAWVFGSVHRSIIKLLETELANRDKALEETKELVEQWQELALRNTALADKAVSVAERKP